MTAAVSAAETQLPSPLPTSLPFTGSHCQQGTCHFCFRRGNGANTVLQLAEALPWPLLCLNLSPSLLLPAVPSVPQVAKQRSYLHSSGRKQSTERNAICPKSWWESMTMWATEALPLSRIRLQLSDCISLHPLNPLVAFPHQAPSNNTFFPSFCWTVNSAVPMHWNMQALLCERKPCSELFVPAQHPPTGGMLSALRSPRLPLLISLPEACSDASITGGPQPIAGSDVRHKGYGSAPQPHTVSLQAQLH